jgi:hypothetical protein
LAAGWNAAAMTELFSELPVDDRGNAIGLAARRAVLTAFAAFSLLALWGLFGQRESESVATGPGVTLRLSAPDTVRGGLFFQSRVDVRATDAIEHPRLVLDEGWVEGMQVNSIEPSPESEAGRDGRVVLSYGRLDPGDRLRIWLQFEVDPTNVGRRSYDLELDDAERPLARIDRTITVLP